MRLFTGIELPGAVKANLEQLIERLRPSARLKWSSSANLHITTKFIGEWPDERLEEVSRALGELPSRPAIEIAVGGLGWFPNAQAPRVFWAGVNAPPALAELSLETDRALSKLGIQRETRAFSPHLTLARIKQPAPLDALRGAIAKLPSEEFDRFTADRFFLYRSELRPSGSVYTKIMEFPFTRP